MTKPTQRTPPGGPPGQQPPPSEASLIGGIVKVPGVERAIAELTAVVEAQKPPAPAPPVNLEDLIDAIGSVAKAISDHAVALRENTEAISDQTTSLKHHCDKLVQHAEAVDENTEALIGLTEVLTPAPPAKATRITLTMEPESSQEKPMDQFYPNQKINARFRFNGPIDGEPVIIAQGGWTGSTGQDPKEELPAQDDPSKIETFVNFHVYCTDPSKIVAGGGGDYDTHPEYNGRHLVSLPCTATVDDPNTQQLEKIHEPFEFVFEWIPATQQKATAISMPSLEAE